MYLNSLNLIGRLVDDPIFKKGSNADGSNDRVWGRIAVNRPGKKDEADFIPFVAWGGTARAVAEHCRKGKVLILEGQLRTKSEQRQDGTYDNYYECNCRSVHFGPDAKNVKRTTVPASTPAATAAPAAPALDPAAAMAMMQQLQAMQALQASQAQAAAPVASADPFGASDIPL